MLIGVSNDSNVEDDDMIMRMSRVASKNLMTQVKTHNGIKSQKFRNLSYAEEITESDYDVMTTLIKRRIVKNLDLDGC